MRVDITKLSVKTFPLLVYWTIVNFIQQFLKYLQFFDYYLQQHA